MKKPILFLTFNRLDATQKVFEEIKKVQPPRLYLASDGARRHVDGEREVVQQTRDFLMNNIDWNCKVETLFREKNLGCGPAVSGAITWFFENEADGIILEDDCLPHPSFFRFCEELLDYYEDNKKIWHISGDQFVPDYDNGASYYFAKSMHCWGWASWADRWRQYEFDLSNYDSGEIKKLSNNANIQNYWKVILEKMKRGEINTWDYQWAFKIIQKDGLCINPSKNLISNIGFGENSTHTSDKDNPLANMSVYEIRKITHPEKMDIDQYAVDFIFKNHFGIDVERKKKNFWELLKMNTAKILKR